MADIFLSYSSADRERVRPVHAALVAKGFDVFWDIETPPGANWDQWIRGKIDKAKVVVVFWTQRSAKSVNVQHEAAIAREDGKLVPVQLEAMRAVDFPMGFYTTQALKLDDWDGAETHAGFAGLAQALKQRCGGNAAEAARKQDEADLAVLHGRAGSGDAEAQSQLGYMYDHGVGVAQDQREALRWYSLAAALGNATARTNLAIALVTGKAGYQKNEVEAVRLLKLAAAQGEPVAQGNLGIAYQRGVGGVEKNEAEAARLMRLAAEAGHTFAMNGLAAILARGAEGVPQDEREAVRLWQASADQGYAISSYNLALMHRDGRGGLAPSEANMIAHFRIAARLGHRAAQESLQARGLGW